MHAPLDFRISVRRFGVWRLGSALIGAAATATACAWAVLSLGAVGWVAALFGCAGIVITAVLARPVPAFSLRWDTQAWHLEPGSSRGQAGRTGHIHVALDLGSWLLLRLSSGSSRRVVWLPVQRRGHEADWPALRRTVHCARPLPVMLSTGAAG
jgi:hypothetical protein